MPAPRNALSRFVDRSGGLDYDPSWGEVARRLPGAFERKARGVAQALPSALLDMLTAGPFGRLNEQLASADATGTPRADAMDYGDLLGTMVPAAGAGMGATAVGAIPRNALGSFGGKIGSAGLDMSQDARMARAKDMGFDTSKVWYHGTRRGAGIDKFDTELGGTSSGGDVVDGVWMTSAWDQADRYGRMADARNKRSYFSPQTMSRFRSDVLELYPPKAERMLVYDAQREAQKLIDEGYGETYRDVMGSMSDWLPSIVAEAKKKGKDGIILKGVQDDPLTGWGYEKAADHIFVFDPRNIRSVNAAFDPARADSSDLLAARVPWIPPPRQDDEKRKQ